MVKKKYGKHNVQLIFVFIGWYRGHYRRYITSNCRGRGQQS